MKKYKIRDFTFFCLMSKIETILKFDVILHDSLDNRSPQFSIPRILVFKDLILKKRYLKLLYVKFAFFEDRYDFVFVNFIVGLF